MARPKLIVPSYQLHKASGQARTYIDGRDFYLGPYGSEASLRRFAELISRHQAALPLPETKPDAEDPGPSVAELILSFMHHAESHYVKNGKPTSEIDCYRSCLRILRELHGITPARDFGPLALKSVRSKMIELGWTRNNINVMVGRVRRVFKYAVEMEMIDVTVLDRLRTVAPLLKGRTKAKDNPRRHAVEDDQINIVREIVQPLVRDLIDLQVLTGARSGSGRDGSEVVLVVIEGGGHTWPGQEPRIKMLGKSTKNMSANDLMWAFFQKHPMK